VDQVQRVFAIRPLARVAVECNGRSAFRQDHASCDCPNVDRLSRQLKKIMRPATHRRKHRELIILLQRSFARRIFLVHCKQQRTSKTFEPGEFRGQTLESSRHRRRRCKGELERVLIDYITCGAKEQHTDLHRGAHSSSIFLPAWPLLFASSWMRARSS